MATCFWSKRNVNCVRAVVVSWKRKVHVRNFSPWALRLAHLVHLSCTVPLGIQRVNIVCWSFSYLQFPTVGSEEQTPNNVVLLGFEDPPQFRTRRSAQGTKTQEDPMLFLPALWRQSSILDIHASKYCRGHNDLINVSDWDVTWEKSGCMNALVSATI